MYEMLFMVPSLLFLNMFSSLFQMFPQEMRSLGKCGTQVCKVFSVFQICHSFSLAKFLGCCARSSDQVILHSIGIRTNPTHTTHIYRWNINTMIYILLWHKADLSPFTQPVYTGVSLYLCSNFSLEWINCQKVCSQLKVYILCFGCQMQFAIL